MERKQRFFIYDRREMGVLLLLGVMVAFFAFTLGVHLGKRVGWKAAPPTGHEAPPVATQADKLPNRQEFQEQAKNTQATVDESVSQSLHDEVARSGLKLDAPRQVDLPEKPRSPEAGATTTRTETPAPAATPTAHETPEEPEAAPKAPAHQARPALTLEDIEAAKRPAPEGKFSLQIGSYSSVADAKDQVDAIEALGLKPLLRAADIKGKGKWYRVYLGGYAGKEEADKAGQRYRSQHVIESFVVTKSP